MFNSAVLITTYNSGVSRRSGIAGNVWDKTQSFPASTPAVVVPPAGADPELMHVGGIDGKIYTFDSGTLGIATSIVSASNPPIAAIVRGIYCANQTVYATVGNSLCAVDPQSGPLWRHDMNGLAWGRPVSTGGVVVAGSWDGQLHAMNPDGTVAWIADQASFFSAEPMAADGVVYAQAWDVLYALDATDGNTIWTASSVEGDTYRGMTLDSDHIYISSDIHIDAINRSDGSRQWHTKLVAFPGDQAVAFGKVFVGTQYGNSPGEFYAMNATDGLIAWQAPFPIGLVGHACSRPYVAQADVPYVFVVGGTGLASAFAWNDGWYAWSAPAGDGSDLMDPVWVDEPVQDPNQLWLAPTEAMRRMRHNPDIRRRIGKTPNV